MASCFCFRFRSHVPDFQVQLYPLGILLQAIERWCREPNFKNGYHISWANEQLETFRRYVSHVEIDFLIRSRIYRKLHHDIVWEDEHILSFKYKITAQLVWRISGDIGDMFKVTKLRQLSHSHSHMDNTLRKDQLVAGFINFLLHLLHSHQDFTAVRECPDVVNRVVKELRILITIIGDRPFRATAHEQVQSILEDFELVVNEAGAFVHSLVFRFKKMKKSFKDILKSIQLFKTKITKFLQQLPNLVFTPWSNSSIDSPFILVCLMHDLEDVMDSDDNTFVEVKKQSKNLHQLLLLCQSIFTGIEVDELKNEHVALQIMSMAYDAKYLVSAFLDGEIPPWYLTVRLTHYVDNIALEATRFQEMKQDFNLMPSKLTSDLCAQLSQQTKKDSLVDDIIVGFEQQEEHVLDLLIGGTKELREVFIYGMAGIGKTTLATRIYHHPLVSRHFDRSSWCVASQMHNRTNMLIGIWNSITNDSEKRERKNKVKKEKKKMSMKTKTNYLEEEGEEEEKEKEKEQEEEEEKEVDLELEIYQILKDRRYLIVMDDIWDSEVWDDLRFLPNDNNGSRILFTSRNKDAAPCGGNGIIHELPLLSNDHCWKLLQKKVFHNNHCPPQLHEVGKRIAANCYGLPLVVVVIAGILSTMGMEESHWENIVQGLNHYIASDKSNSIMKILEVSYKHLPQHLQICFLYFRVFKEDEKIHVRKLLQLWVAEGFICKEGENKRAECVAKEYLAELIDKNLVIVVEKGSDGGAKVCIIHDLLHELCLKIAEKDDFLKLTDSDRIMRKSNDLWIYHSKHIYGKPLYRASPNHLESSSSVCERWISSFSFDRTEVRARVIDGEPFFVFGFPEDEVLYASRYLSLRKMPRSLHKFVNLEFLIVHSDVDISPQILEMVKLKFICAYRADFRGDCDMSSRTSKIEYLSKVFISRQKDLKKLACLPVLHKLKCGYTPWKEENGSVGCLDLLFLTQLECLSVECLRVESFRNFYDMKFPSNVRKLTLSVVEICPRMMATIGALPCLHVLKLEGKRSPYREERWDTSDGEFKQLRILKLRRLNLTQWNVPSSEHFPKLKQLSLEDCSKLIEIPREIGEIETLQFIEVRRKCKKSLVDSAKQIEQEQKDMGNEEFRVDMQKLWIYG